MMLRMIGTTAVTAVVAGFSICLSLGAAVNATPQVNASEKNAPASASSAAVEQMHLASGLADWGRKNRNARALVLAADMVSGVGETAVARTKIREGAGAADAAQRAETPGLTVAALLDEARSLAGLDQAILTEISQLAERASKGGGKEGPRSTRDRVLGGETDTYSIPFRGGERAALLVEGDGSTDLDLFVYDQNDHFICSDTDSTDTMLCQWTPAWTGTFTVRIKNYGKVPNAYLLQTN